ncbi:MAG: nuclease-like protein [Ramlibacter sp.]|jgi:micrococcal nuclease|uniref:thermonuclease family protein n=1 Tax=Ramlibacter sp. TaxID=1917967 RepID=UPI0026215BC3|nr:thermonuclease family protein [Ramlibacter sp.]MDB5752503.1 nuclease-like protein [Ramlibacter sp.]
MRLPAFVPMLVLLALLAMVGLPAAAATFGGVVTHVTDGDTLWVRPDGERETVEIRLLGIDAPEGCQAFGPQAKKALAARVLKQRVQVRSRGQDDYRRTLAQVRHRNQDVGAWLVGQGHAWSTDYRGRPGRYERLEEQAKRERRGLWAGLKAIEPRHFRRSHGRCL